MKNLNVSFEVAIDILGFTKNEKIINEIYSILENQLNEEYKELFI